MIALYWIWDLLWVETESGDQTEPNFHKTGGSTSSLVDVQIMELDISHSRHPLWSIKTSFSLNHNDWIDVTGLKLAQFISVEFE